MKLASSRHGCPGHSRDRVLVRNLDRNRRDVVEGRKPEVVDHSRVEVDHNRVGVDHNRTVAVGDHKLEAAVHSPFRILRLEDTNLA